MSAIMRSLKRITVQEQKQGRELFPADVTLGLVVRFEKAIRLLSFYFAISDQGSNGIVPSIEHLGSAGQTLGKWFAANPVTGGFYPANTPLEVMGSTAQCTEVAGVVSTTDGNGYSARICIPADLVVLPNESLRFKLSGSIYTPPSGQTGDTALTGDIFFRYLEENVYDVEE